MKCTLVDCPGGYDRRLVAHTARHRGQLVVLDHVPAEVCDVCGDVLFTPDTVRHIEELLATRPRPAAIVPLYEYA